MDGFTTLHNPTTGGYWPAPDALVDELLAGGEWERCEEPDEVNPATAEHAAWRAQRAAETAPTTPAEGAPVSTRAARRGESPKE